MSLKDRFCHIEGHMILASPLSHDGTFLWYYCRIFLHTSPTEPMLKKHDISNNIVKALKAHGKRALVDINCYCKMMSVVALDGVTSFLHFKYATYSCKRIRHSPTIGWISSVQWLNAGRS